MNFKDVSNIGKSYKDFVLISIDDLPDYKAKGVFLRHKKTGLEVYHVCADDKENLFAFAFRTVAKDSLGTAHIMEHSTLCGSEKYPLKEPFNTLESTSLNTFLNALTYPDKTVYPGASVVKADYFNMFDVYADSVFFPKLDYTTFMQEGHRLELDENDKLSIQGVVYNEMKGSYSSFSPIAYSQLVAAMFPDSYPVYDSGGDPVNIPELTYEQFLEFHQKFYNPDNCLLFLYGNIPTEEQLDYFDKNFISRIEKKYCCNEDVSYLNNKTPHIKSEIKDLMKLKKNDKSGYVKNFGPVEGSTGSFVTINWYTGKHNLEKMYLTEVLNGNDSSPVSNALRISELGDEVVCGNFGQYEEHFYVMGLFGVEKGDEDKVFDLVHKTVQEVAENGVSKEDIDAALMGMDFHIREENRYFGPPSMEIMERVLKSWCYGNECNSMLNTISDFEKIKEEIRKDKDYTKKLIHKYFIENPVQIKFVSEPSEDYFAERNKKEADLISELEVGLDKEKLRKELEDLHAYQQKVETPEETACIPTTDINTLDRKIDFAKTNLEFLAGKENSETKNLEKIPFFVNEEETKGIFYLDVMFPFDTVDPKYYKHISSLTQLITNMGWNGKKWEDCILEGACITGDMWGRNYICSNLNPAVSKENEEYKKYNYFGRQWLGVSCKALTEKAEETLNLMYEAITKCDFQDLKRFQSLLTEIKADKKSGLVQAGRGLAMKRAKAGFCVENAITEICTGLTDYMNVLDIDCDNLDELKQLMEVYEKIYYESLASGVIIHITADKDSLNKLKPLLEEFSKKCNFEAVKPARELTVEMLLPYIYQVEALGVTAGKNLDSDGCSDDCSDNRKEPVFVEQDLKTKSQTGYSVCITKASPLLTKEAAAEGVFTNWFSNHILWDKVRTTGGAYGAFAGVNTNLRFCVMSSYRDPAPANTVKVMKQALKDMEKIEISEEDVEKTIVSYYGEKIIPQTARERGSRSFEDLLHGFMPEHRQKSLDYLFDITQKDVMEAARRIAKWSDEIYSTAVFCDNSVQTCGNIINIPL